MAMRPSGHDLTISLRRTWLVGSLGLLACIWSTACIHSSPHDAAHDDTRDETQGTQSQTFASDSSIPTTTLSDDTAEETSSSQDRCPNVEGPEYSQVDPSNVPSRYALGNSRANVFTPDARVAIVCVNEPAHTELVGTFQAEGEPLGLIVRPKITLAITQLRLQDTLSLRILAINTALSQSMYSLGHLDVAGQWIGLHQRDSLIYAATLTQNGEGARTRHLTRLQWDGEGMPRALDEFVLDDPSRAPAQVMLAGKLRYTFIPLLAPNATTVTVVDAVGPAGTLKQRGEVTITGQIRSIRHVNEFDNTLRIFSFPHARESAKNSRQVVVPTFTFVFFNATGQINDQREVVYPGTLTMPEVDIMLDGNNAFVVQGDGTLHIVGISQEGDLELRGEAIGHGSTIDVKDVRHIGRYVLVAGTRQVDAANFHAAKSIGIVRAYDVKVASAPALIGDFELASVDADFASASYIIDKLPREALQWLVPNHAGVQLVNLTRETSSLGDLAPTTSAIRQLDRIDWGLFRGPIVGAGERVVMTFNSDDEEVLVPSSVTEL